MGRRRFHSARVAGMTEAHGLLTIFTSSQPGMGRTGKLFHYEHGRSNPTS